MVPWNLGNRANRFLSTALREGSQEVTVCGGRIRGRGSGPAAVADGEPGVTALADTQESSDIPC